VNPQSSDAARAAAAPAARAVALAFDDGFFASFRPISTAIDGETGLNGVRA
jgi:hypothetical protein